MKKTIMTLGSTVLMTSLLLAGCEEDTKPAVENQNVEDMDYHSRQSLTKDKQKNARQTKNDRESKR